MTVSEDSMEAEIDSSQSLSDSITPIQFSAVSRSLSVLGSVVVTPYLLICIHIVLWNTPTLWQQLRYTRVSHVSPATSTPPIDLVPPTIWHGLTRLTHATVHSRTTIGHLLGDAVLILVASVSLAVFMQALQDDWDFVGCYWQIVLGAPIIGSYAFDVFGRTATGYGSSTIGFAFLGALSVATGVYIYQSPAEIRSVLPSTLSSSTGEVQQSVRESVQFAGVAFAASTVLLASDLAVNSGATPVHQSSAVFGAIIAAGYLASVNITTVVRAVSDTR